MTITELGQKPASLTPEQWIGFGFKLSKLRKICYKNFFQHHINYCVTSWDPVPQNISYCNEKLPNIGSKSKSSFQIHVKLSWKPIDWITVGLKHCCQLDYTWMWCWKTFPYNEFSLYINKTQNRNIIVLGGISSLGDTSIYLNLPINQTGNQKKQFLIEVFIWICNTERL